MNIWIKILLVLLIILVLGGIFIIYISWKYYDQIYAQGKTYKKK